MVRLAATCTRLAASRRKSSSAECTSVASAIMPLASMVGSSQKSQAARRSLCCRSCAMRVATSGCCTLSTTRSPETRRAACTWRMMGSAWGAACGQAGAARARVQRARTGSAPLETNCYGSLR
eukprot:scaffold702_cov48-Phaeocystis_antarctica.AAC.2